MGSQGCHICDDPRHRLSGKGRLRVRYTDPPRVLALVEEPDDGGLRPPLLESEW